MRMNTLEALAIIVKIEGRRANSRQRMTFLDWITATCGDQWINTKVENV